MVATCEVWDLCIGENTKQGEVIMPDFWISSKKLVNEREKKLVEDEKKDVTETKKEEEVPASKPTRHQEAALTLIGE